MCFNQLFNVLNFFTGDNKLRSFRCVTHLYCITVGGRLLAALDVHGSLLLCCTSVRRKEP